MFGGSRQHLRLRYITEAGRRWVRRKQQLYRPKAQRLCQLEGQCCVALSSEFKHPLLEEEGASSASRKLRKLTKCRKLRNLQDPQSLPKSYKSSNPLLGGRHGGSCLRAAARAPGTQSL